MRRLALESFYNTVRTFNCISLTYSSMIEALGAMQCFDNLTADHLKVAFKGYFIESDGAKLKALSHHYPLVMTNADDPKGDHALDKLTVSKEDYRELLRDSSRPGE